MGVKYVILIFCFFAHCQNVPVIPYYLPYPEFDGSVKQTDYDEDEAFCARDRLDPFKTFAFLKEEDSPCCWVDKLNRELRKKEICCCFFLLEVV